jgi:hypothetical protein
MQMDTLSMDTLLMVTQLAGTAAGEPTNQLATHP